MEKTTELEKKKQKMKNKKGDKIIMELSELRNRKKEKEKGNV